MRTIKNRTYRNFMIIMNRILDKGYDRQEAEKITRRIFDEYELNPNGLSVNALEARIIPAAEWRLEYE